jgi:hypothetical protein
MHHNRGCREMSANSYLLRGGQVYTMDPDQPWAQ